MQADCPVALSPLDENRRLAALRALLGYESPRQWRLPDIRSLSGAIVLLGLVLYPYVYLSARAAFLTQSRQLMEAARMLGHGSWAVFGRVVLPLARPATVTVIILSFIGGLRSLDRKSVV